MSVTLRAFFCHLNLDQAILTSVAGFAAHVYLIPHGNFLSVFDTFCRVYSSAIGVSHLAVCAMMTPISWNYRRGLLDISPSAGYVGGLFLTFSTRIM